MTGLTRTEVCTPIVQYTQNTLQESTPTRVITYVITPRTPTIQTPRATDTYYNNNTAMMQTMTPRLSPQTPRTPQLTIQNNSHGANLSGRLPSSMSLSNTTSNSNNNNVIVSANRDNVNTTNVPYNSAVITPTVLRPQPLFAQEIKPKINTTPQNITSIVTNNNNNNNNIINNMNGSGKNTNANRMTSTETILSNNTNNMAQRINTNINNFTNNNNNMPTSIVSRPVASPITTASNVYNTNNINNNVNNILNNNNNNNNNFVNTTNPITSTKTVSPINANSIPNSDTNIMNNINSNMNLPNYNK